MKEVLKLALEALERGETKLRWEAITAIKEALAQPEMRPDEISTEELIYMAGLHDGKMRPWVGLTDEEINAAAACQSWKPFARAIEAKLKEKNT